MDLSITPAVYVRLGAVTAIRVSNMHHLSKSLAIDSGKLSHNRHERHSLPGLPGCKSLIFLFNPNESEVHRKFLQFYSIGSSFAITEQCLEGTFKGHLVQLLCHGHLQFNQLRASSNVTLNVFRIETSVISLGNLLPVCKKFFPLCSANRSFFHLKQLPLVLLQ